MKTYLVGGAVRDLLMGNPVQDRDYVVVGSTPELMLIQGYEQVGAAFPVFLNPETKEEYALARTETKNGVGYHGFDVAFGRDVTLQDDLSRRDLTINSIALDETTNEFIDPFDGIGDLNRKILRHTSDAFKDDPLRVIRLCRFAARFIDFKIDDVTWQLASKMVKDGELNYLPPERFATEIEKVFKTCSFAHLRRFFDLLHLLHVDEYVTFFRGINCKRLADLALKIKAVAPSKDHMTVFAAVAQGSPQFCMAIGDAEGSLMAELLKQNRQSCNDDSKPEALNRLLNRIGLHVHSKARLEMFCDVCEIAQSDRVTITFGRAPLMNGWNAVAGLSSMLAPELVAKGLTGSEIGREINLARLESLTAMLKLYNL